MASALSRDGRWLALERIASSGNAQANRDLWMWDFARRTMTRLTSNPAREGIPALSPDGMHLYSPRTATEWRRFYRKDTSGTGEEERLTDGPHTKVPLDRKLVTAYLLYRQQAGQTNWD